MKVLVVSDFQTHGGAAMAATRVCVALAERGHEVVRLVCRPDDGGEGGRVMTLHWRSQTGALGRLRRRLTPRAARGEVDRRVVERAFASVAASVRPDVVHFHNIHNAVSAGWSDQLLRLARSAAPVVWTLHDMWSFTGRCAYAHGCDRFTRQCDAQCPTSDEYPALAPELILPTFERRREVLAELADMVAVTPSQWLAGQAQRGLWAGHRVRVINYGLVLGGPRRPVDRAAIRREMGLPEDGVLLLAAAADWSSPHKGAAELAEALRRLASSGPRLLLLGRGGLPAGVPAESVIALGFVPPGERQSLLRRAADVLVHPARAENFSNVLLEAAVDGLPVAAFAIGGNPEIVIDGRTGALAGEVSGAGLAGAVERALAMRAADAGLGDAIAAQGRARFDVRREAAEYEALYAELTGGRGGGVRTVPMAFAAEPAHG